MKRQHRTVGAVLQVPVSDGMCNYALTLPEADFAFFGPPFREPMKDLRELLSLPMLFRAAVHKFAWSQGRWLKIGKITVPEGMLAPRPMFIQHSNGLHQICLGGSITKASREQCEGLERAVVWGPHHIEERLNARFKGVPCRWETLYRLK